MTNFNSTLVSYISPIKELLPSSIAKTLFVDTVINGAVQLFSWKMDIMSTVKLHAAAPIGYYLRESLKSDLKDVNFTKYMPYLGTIFSEESLNKYIPAVIAGAAGGSTRYGITGQNLGVGMLNNILYELCEAYELCGKDPYARTAFTVIVETIDASAQAYITGGNIKSAVQMGLTIGALVSLSVENLYIPVATNNFSFVDEYFNKGLSYLPKFIGDYSNNTETSSEL